MSTDNLTSLHSFFDIRSSSGSSPQLSRQVSHTPSPLAMSRETTRKHEHDASFDADLSENSVVSKGISHLPEIFLRSSPVRKARISIDNETYTTFTIPHMRHHSNSTEESFTISFTDPEECHHPELKNFFCQSNTFDTDTEDRPDDQHSIYPALTETQLLSHNTLACLHSLQFPKGHKLNPYFVKEYQLEDELGSGGYGFVMTAKHRVRQQEFAVKFIIKDKVPEHAWMEVESIGRLPTEVMILNFIHHENIIRCLDLYEDSLYFYLVQELHGSPWPKNERSFSRNYHPASSSGTSATIPTPSLSPTASEHSSNPSQPPTPPIIGLSLYDSPKISDHTPAHLSTSDVSVSLDKSTNSTSMQSAIRKDFSRRPSHDLFECIEQSDYKRLPEPKARFVFSQVVDAVHFLDSQGITHRDIKDENLLIDKNFKVKLIDFGSAIIVDPTEPRPYYNQFYGTAAYASSEILLKHSYQASPAEVWTLGVLLSYLLTGASPFPSVRDAVGGHMRLVTPADGSELSKGAIDLMRRCLDSNPRLRATISEVKAHSWLNDVISE